MRNQRNKLIELRTAKNLTQNYIAEKLGISRSFYTMIENGNRNPSLELAIKLADLFQVNVRDIFLTDLDDKNLQDQDTA
ncbi:helix-turn-helix transcriptional regulator [Thermotalea metallivorans]|uniref:HTH-type transcriptional regulator Xre n=1 Tax=Thermotalea metallivorans TaxID=520762 RepID=A0A140KZV3_9FIRM|nr:helix-turn-helix transcriptional regulator [Thermotalea metallivorans]KXG73828.1 HTH-type transcriptional regulator Xre [Thermotalea metallivorans]